MAFEFEPGWIEGRIVARVYRRTKTTNASSKSEIFIGKPIECLDANGKSRLGLIGSGEFTANTAFVAQHGLRRGDIVTVVQETQWGRFPVTGTGGNQRIACFIIRNIKDNGDHTMVVSGDDRLAELQDYVALSPIGGATEYRIGILAGNPGKRTYLLKEQYAIGTEIVHIIGIPNEDSISEGDEIQVLLDDGTRFSTEVKEIIAYITGTGPAEMKLRLKDLLPRGSGASRTFVYIFTPRIQVATDVSNVFVVGERVRISTDDRTADGRYIIFETRIDGFEEKEVEVDDETETHYYVRFETAPIQTIPLQDPLDPATVNVLISVTYDQAVTTDIADLLRNDTFGDWKVAIRDADCTIGTTYEPSGESVWDAMSAMLETSGYVVKQIKRWSDPTFPDKRELRVMNPANPLLPTGTVTDIIADTRLIDHRPGAGQATILNTPKVDTEGTPVTHCIPFGAGGGQARFDITMADLAVLDPYNAWLTNYVYKVGRQGGQWVVFRDVLPGGEPENQVWRSQTFSHIRPINEGNVIDQRAAANQLLIAAVEYLEESRKPNLSIDVDVHTIGDPQPGDRVGHFYSNLAPENVIDYHDLIISEVEHKVTAGGGPRTTRLLLTRNRGAPETGQELVARYLRGVTRYMANTNAPTAGGTRFYNNRIVFRGDAVVGTSSGVALFTSQNSDIQVSAHGRIFMDSGDEVWVSNAAIVKGVVEARSGVRWIDDNRDNWTHNMRVIDGIPRMVATGFIYNQGAPGDEVEDGFDEGIGGISLY